MNFNDYLKYLQSYGYGASYGMTEPAKAFMQSKLPYGQTYEQELENVREDRKQRRKEQPVGSAVAETLGALSSAPMAITKGVKAATTLGGIAGYNEDQTLGSTLLGAGIGLTGSLPFSKGMEKTIKGKMAAEEAVEAAKRGDVGLNEMLQRYKALQETAIENYPSNLNSWLGNEQEVVSDLMGKGYKALNPKNADLGSELLTKAKSKLLEIKRSADFMTGPEGNRGKIPMDAMARYRDITEPKIQEYRKLLMDYAKIAGK